jgi:large subunit ribosomal protein L5
MITKEKNKSAYKTLAPEFGYTNMFASPRLMKVVVSAGVGKADKNRKAMIMKRLADITGQKPSPRAAKTSIAQFKLREGEIVGYQVTLRGDRMFDFLDKLVHIALPRTRDFRGLNATAIDGMGNLTIGLKEHSIFPEASEEDLKDVFGLAITLVTTAKNKPEAEAFFRHLGIPLKVAA